MKIKIWLLIAATLLPWSCHIAVAADKRDTAASTVLALQKAWNDAYKRGDVLAMNALLADDYIITVEDGNTFSKPGYIARNGNSTVHVDISKMSNLKVRVHGNTAVVTGAYYEKGTEKGKPYEYRDRLTDVWMNTNGRWQLIVSHYSLPTQSTNRCLPSSIFGRDLRPDNSRYKVKTVCVSNSSQHHRPKIPVPEHNTPRTASGY